ncbi:MAG: hypothetical protein ABI661_02195, partial [Gammaproteobacteria bacterium]
MIPQEAIFHCLLDLFCLSYRLGTFPVRHFTRYSFRSPVMQRLIIFAFASTAVLIAGCSNNGSSGRSGPANAGTPPVQQRGDAANGQQVFRMETFGDEGFFTDAMRLPQGIVAAGVTPVQAL